MPSVLNFGSLNIDYVYGVEHFVSAGETLASTSREVFAGGKGLNQSIAFAKAGCSVFHAGAVGKFDGEILLDVLKGAGIDISNIQLREDVTSGHTVIQVDKNGQNCILLYGGANQSLQKNHIKQVLSKFTVGDLLMLQNEVNNLDYMMEEASARGIQIAFNVSPFCPALLNLPLHLCSYLLVNEVEAAGIAQCSPNEKPEKLLAALEKHLPDVNIVLTLGARGSIFKPVGSDPLYQGIFKVQAIDTTASGDTYTGFLLGSLLQGKNAKEALKIAACAAAIAVTRKGASPSIPLLEDVLGSDLIKNQICPFNNKKAG
ncbi:ribokinase [uncultured Succinatimonas sp.]|uniref:ribokinase n=1 Tax=uncultured Succinatimonas sp. TaxID=1262973 RepID=UPI0025CC4637|nr:ribokinase [uncultured Succinatimonas sp.]